MAGIVSFGAYVPYYRLGKGEISKAWGGGAIPGERAVASYDQDAITMGVEAARDCLIGINKQTVDGVLFASSSSPYKEKQSAAVVAAYLGLPSGITTIDIANSLRAGTSAVKLAADMVEAGSRKNVLVVASDCRMPFPQSALEQNSGDGAGGWQVATTTLFQPLLQLAWPPGRMCLPGFHYHSLNFW